LGIYLSWGVFGIQALAFVGGLTAVAAVYGIGASLRSGDTIQTLVLTGVVVGSDRPIKSCRHRHAVLRRNTDQRRETAVAHDTDPTPAGAGVGVTCLARRTASTDDRRPDRDQCVRLERLDIRRHLGESPCELMPKSDGHGRGHELVAGRPFGNMHIGAADAHGLDRTFSSARAELTVLLRVATTSAGVPFGATNATQALMS